MEKYIVVVRPGRTTSQPGCRHDELAAQMHRFARTLADHDVVTNVWFTHTVGPAPRSMLPLRNGPAGCVSVKVRSREAVVDGRDGGAAGGGGDAAARVATNDDVDGRAAAAIIARRLLLEAGAADLPGFSGIYRATEALPVRYERGWPDGVRTPGVCLLTLFHRPPRLDYGRFIHRWHVGHTGLSLRLHPLWHYNRNVVEQVGTQDFATAGNGSGTATIERTGAGSPVGAVPDATPPFDGIVEEHFRCRKDLLNPFRFYGRFPAILWNMLTILVDILGFIDLKRIETYLTRETIVKSSPEGAAHSVATAVHPFRDRVPADLSASES
jgi:hypothetical protein